MDLVIFENTNFYHFHGFVNHLHFPNLGFGYQILTKWRKLTDWNNTVVFARQQQPLVEGATLVLWVVHPVKQRLYFR